MGVSKLCSLPIKDEIAELLDAPEGAHYQFKEAKNRYDFEDALKCCCALSNSGGGKFVLVFSNTGGFQIISIRLPGNTRTLSPAITRCACSVNG